MSPRRTQPPPTPPDLSPERAYSALANQLEALQALKSMNYQEGEPKETEWANLTEKLLIRAFGSDSANLQHFHRAESAGSYYIRPFGGGVDHHQNQNNYNERIQSFEGVVKSCLAELKLDLPEAQLKGAYSPGEEYEFYKDVKYVLQLAQAEVLVIDPYLDTEIFDVYAGALPRSVSFRFLSANIPPSVVTLHENMRQAAIFSFGALTASTIA